MADVRCVFCGSSGPLSSEHVIPYWIGEHMGVVGRDRRGKRRYAPPVEHQRRTSRDDAIEQTLAFEAPPYTWTVRSVCEACNTGWMNELERQAAPLLKPMLQGRAVRLDSASQNIIARWAFKTALVMRSRQPEQFRPPDAHYAAMRSGELPPGTSVRLAATDFVEAQVFSTPTLTANGTRAWATTFSVERIVVQTFASDPSDAMAVRLGRGQEEILVQIAPSHEDEARWPPARVLDAEQLRDAAAVRHGDGGPGTVDIVPPGMPLERSIVSPREST